MQDVVLETINNNIVDAKFLKLLKYGIGYKFKFWTGKENYLLGYILQGDRSVRVYLDGQRVSSCSDRNICSGE